MDMREQLVAIVQEEAIEVTLELAKVCSKTNRFGLYDTHLRCPEKGTNQQRLIQELNELQAAIQLLVQHGVIPERWQSKKVQAAKRAKIVRMLLYSRNVSGGLTSAKAESPAAMRRLLKAHFPKRRTLPHASRR